MDLRERCYRCGHTWGVTMPPRDWVLCGTCARPAPNWGDVPHYWRHRADTGWPALRYRSPEWWDQQTSRADLLRAVAICKTNLGIPAGVAWGGGGSKRPEWLDADLPPHITAHAYPPA